MFQPEERFHAYDYDAVALIAGFGLSVAVLPQIVPRFEQ